MSSSKTTLSKLVTALGKARIKRVIAYEKYTELRNNEALIRTELYAELQTVGLLSAKGEDYTASIVQKPTIVIRHEQTVMNWLRETPNIESDLYIGIKQDAFKGLAQSVLKTTGEIIPGAELEMRENLSIRSNIKKEIETV